MLGSVADAEDAVQEAFVKLEEAPVGESGEYASFMETDAFCIFLISDSVFRMSSQSPTCVCRLSASSFSSSSFSSFHARYCVHSSCNKGVRHPKSG
jgi:hypothetical protein